MSLPHNSARGEVPLSVGGVDLVIAAEMGRLAKLSTALGCQSFGELYQKLLGVELAAVRSAIENLTVAGDVGKALNHISIRDLTACATAFAAALAFQMGDGDQGNAEAAGDV